MTRERFHAVFLAAIMLLSVVAMGAGFAGSAAAQSDELLVVDDDFNNPDQNGNFSSLQAAVDAAAEDDAIGAIEVRPGSYDAVSVDVSGLTIFGPTGGASSATINGQGANQGALTIAANNVTVSNLNISAGGGQPAVTVLSDTEGLELTSSVIVPAEENLARGLVVYGGGSDHDVIGNTFVTPSTSARLAYVNGDTSVGKSSSNVDFIDNTFTSGNVGNGVVLGHEGTNSTIAQNEFNATSEYGQVELFGQNIEVASNSFVPSNGFQIKDAGGSLDEHVVYSNEFEHAAFVNKTSDSDRRVYSSLSPAVEAASGPATVALASGTYDENVTVDTPNVSIVGEGDDTVINGLVYLKGENVTLTDVAVEPDQFVRPSGDDGIPNNEKQAILITASNVSVYDSTVDVSLDANGDFEEVNAIQVFGGEPITDVRIINNDITGTASNDEVAGVVGVSDQAETERTLISNNSISVDSEGYSFGVVTRASGGTNVEETPETVVVYNDIDATADAYPGVGYGVESTDEAQVDADAQILKDNTFGDIDSIQLKAAGGTLDVTMNEWEDIENVSFRTDGFGTPVQNGGEIVYDPFLTSAPPSPENFTRPGERTDFGHDLVVPADGEPHSVAFPAPVDGTVSEVFGEFDGTVYAYDGDEWESGEEVRDEHIDALDAFAVTVDEGEQDIRIDFEYAESDDPVPSMTTADLEEGWNFVGAPSGSVNSDEAFAGSTADVTTVIDAIAGPNSETTPYGLDASGEVSNPGEVSPFKGYWVFVTDDGELGATVPVEPTQETEEGALTGN
jgi:surface glycoprotein (TIGR04207 family)